MPLYKTFDDTKLLEEDSALGRNGSAKKFFENGYKPKSRLNNNFIHLDAEFADQDPVLDAMDGLNAFDSNEGAGALPTVQRNLAAPLDAAADCKGELHLENCDAYGVRDGLLTFFLPPKKRLADDQFAEADGTPVAKKRREAIARAAEVEEN